MSALAALDGIAAIQEADFAVASAISVREQYKTKLHSLVDALLPTTAPTTLIHARKTRSTEASAPPNATTDASMKKQTRDAIADRLRTRATMPAGKELQVVGDWLLLLRAASVNVVESIVDWRHVVHQDRPLPYEVDHVNYLLQMTRDLDFLDQCDDLVSWLGFRLVRNPFIVTGGLDANAHDALPVAGDRRKHKAKGAVQPSPPMALVKPLVSITPEDDVVDGSRIVEAHFLLTEEEALYGRTTTAQLAQTFLEKPLEALLGETDDDDPQAQYAQNKSTVFDTIAAMTKALRRVEQHLTRLRREHLRGTDVAKQINDQIRCTTAHRDHDLVSDHRVWQYRNKCRESTLQLSQKALGDVNGRIESLQLAIAKAEDLVLRRTHQLEQLVALKDRARQQRHEEKRRLVADDVARRAEAIRSRTLERNREFKANREKKKPPKNEDVLPPEPTLQGVKEDESGDVELVAPIGAPASPVDQRKELYQIRTKNLERRLVLRLQQEQILSDEAREMNRRRNENAQMFLEDRRSWAVETRRRQIIREQQRKDRVKKLMATPICSIVHAIDGVGGGSSDKKCVISVYQHRAEGYAPDGLRFVAYDPSASKSLSLLISTREYRSLGYGRTLEGISAFCQWLCVIYEKRKRQFKLIWSGAPCPPPLRLREYDNALICVHKEGIRGMQNLPSFSVVAVYIRTNDPSTLRLVVYPVDSGDNIVEYAVAGSQLLPADSLLLRSDFKDGGLYVSWLHTLNDEKDANPDSGSSSTRVYSGEMSGIDGKRPVRVHIYDASSTEYELHIGKSPPPESETGVLPQKPIVLLKHDVNPYHVRLPASAFGDLLNCVKLETCSVSENGAGGTATRASILPSWRAYLARYVRALRMGRFGCKIDGVFHLIVVTLVQQKTEFRAHLLFEFVPVGETRLRHSLRISLSQLLRCPHATRRFTGGRLEEGRHCYLCLDNHSRTTAVPIEDSLHTGNSEHSECEYHIPCGSCNATQTSRLAILRTLLETGAPPSESALASLRYATCVVCGAMPLPLVVVVPSRGNGGIAESGIGREGYLESFFTCFNLDAYLDQDSVAAIHYALEHNRICVVRIPAPTIGTYANTNSAASLVRRILCPEENGDLSITIVVVYALLDMFNCRAEHEAVEDSLSPPQVLESAIRDVAAAILHVGDATPIASDAAEDDQDSIANFEGYLISEALLVEATRVLLEPDMEWRMPGETVGAWSWSSACGYLQNPRQLSHDLQNRQTDILHMTPSTYEIIEAYAAHPKWPVNLNDVRPPFQPLLSCVLHIVYVQRLLNLEGGLLSAAGHQPHNRSTTDDDSGGIYEIQNGARVIIVSHQ